MSASPELPASSERYSRQERLPQIGSEGQERLRRSTVAVIGLGALGSVAADLLARAGVGRLLLIDRDIVEWSNLQRQSLYDEEDARRGRLKAEAAAQRLAAVNSEVACEALPVDLSASQAEALLDEADLLLDGTDNFETRYLLNDYAVRDRRPYVYAAVVASYGMVGAVVPEGPCLRCTFPEHPDAADTPTCRTAGVLGPAVSVISGLAVGEAVKLLVGHASDVFPGYRYVDLWSNELRALEARRDPECPCCVARDFAWLRGERGARQAHALCGGNAVQVPAAGAVPDLPSVAAKLEGAVEDLRVKERYLRYRAAGLEVMLFSDGRSLVRGTEDPARARAVLARTLGA